MIGERSKPPSDKLGGEIFYFLERACIFVTIYMVSYGLITNTLPTCIMCAHTHLKSGSYACRRDQKSVFFRRVAGGSNRIEFYSTRRGTFLTLQRGNQITIDIESERQSDCTNIRYSYQQELLLYNNNIESILFPFNFVSTLKGLHVVNHCRQLH